MRLFSIIALCAIFCALLSCTATPPTAPPSSPSVDQDVIGYLLAQQGLDRSTAHCDPEILKQLVYPDMLLQQHFMRYWENPYEFPKFAYSLADTLENYAPKDSAIYNLAAVGFTRTGRKVTGYLQYIPRLEPEEGKDPLETALKAIFEESRVPLDESALKATLAPMAELSPELRLQMARFIFAAANAKLYRDRAFRNYPREKWETAFRYLNEENCFPEDGIQNLEYTPEMDIIGWDLAHCADFSDLYTGATTELRQIVEFQEFLNLHGGPYALREKPAKPAEPPAEKARLDVKFEISTPLGKLSYNGLTEDNDYTSDEYFLIIDLGGNDTYRGSAAASWSLERPISTVLDFAGDDKYLADKSWRCSQGAGVMGYGILADYAGNDEFKGYNKCQGAASFGVGILFANGGDDTFTAYYGAQGSGAYGVGQLLKVGGNDKYSARYISQGFGFVCGFGSLVDTGGDDIYWAEPYNPLFNPGVNGHDNLRNYSFCQGAGWGQRGDLSGGHSMAGGTGVLQDLGGNDSYTCGVYGQATGYWYGTGILHDKSGDDSYEGSFFVQSGTAHMGLTALLEDGGNDSYHVWHAISLGGAHDVSVSYLIDRGGNDKVSCWEWKDDKGGQSIAETAVKAGGGGILGGAAITSSIGAFINIGGNDRYELYTKDGLGYSFEALEKGSWRNLLYTVGLFIDIGGKDDYVVTGLPEGWPIPANDTMWDVRDSKRENFNIFKTFGMGIDVEEGKVIETER